ncbi:MAG: iron ABC transporter substrate-binding protein [Acidimicrobiia bacterium]|nr:iron ABC transporter substrate-binding protein [Acidimicrobiia bacterium]
MRRFIILILVLATLAAGCGNDADLTVYSGRNQELVQPLIDQFIAETGLDVEVRYAGSAELAATLVEEGDSSPADLFFAQDPASLGRVALTGLLLPLPSGVLALVPEEFSDADGRWVGVSGRARTLVYDPIAVDPVELPVSVDGLTDPQWQGRVAIAPTNSSFLAFVAAMIQIEGEAATRTWLEQMSASPTYSKNSTIVAAVNGGEVEMGLVNHYYPLQAAEEPDATAANFFFPGGGPGALVMPAGVGVLASTDDEDTAIRFIEFLLSADAQGYFATETYEFPLVPGVAADPRLPALDEITAPDLDLSRLAETLDLATELVTELGL